MTSHHDIRFARRRSLSLLFATALADRVLLVEDGRISLDLRIDLPRPRVRGTPAFAALEQGVLSRVLGRQEETG